MRAAYRVLAMLVAIGVVVQVAVVAWGWFAVLHSVDDGGTFAKGDETAGMEAHGAIGYRNAGQCSALQGGGEGPRWEGRKARAVP